MAIGSWILQLKDQEFDLPDLIFGQSGVQMPKDGFQVYCDDAHCHVLSELPGERQSLQGEVT